MGNSSTTLLAAAVSLAVLVPSASFASSSAEQARRLCENKIRDVYGVSNFRHVSEEHLGHHKYRVYGKVRAHGHGYPFSCKWKQGRIKSYSYDGPRGRSGDSSRDRRDSDDDGSDLGKALAVGVGLAIVAALASQSGDDDGDHKTSSLHVDKSILEDDCHDQLQYRIRDEHRYGNGARVHIKNSRIDGYDLKGDAKVRYPSDHPHHATFTCHFDRNGRIRDSSYHLY